MTTTKAELSAATALPDTGNYVHLIGKKQFELSNHLGNVLSSISDKLIAKNWNNDQTVDSYKAEILFSQDYTPFGVKMDGRTFTNSYRYGFNGKETDDETGIQDYGMRIYNPALARFLSVDPIAAKYPMLTPYQFASNTPIQAVDLDGLEMYYAADGSYIGQYGTSTEIRIVDARYMEAAQMVVTGAPGASGINQRLYNEGSTGVFTDPDQAAEDWGMRYNGPSITDEKENASQIYELNIEGMTYYTYTTPQPWTEGHSSQSSVPTPAPEGTIVVADIHSHADFLIGFNNELFSPTDVQNMKDNQYPGYLTTPAGALKKWDPCDPNRKLVLKGQITDPSFFGDSAPLSKSLPSDPGIPTFAPKDQRRLNDVPPKKQEPKYPEKEPEFPQDQ